LGEFHVAEPLSVLLQAATIERDPREADVRRSAIEAIAVLGSNVGADRLQSHGEVLSALTEAAEDARPPLRSTAAFALGVIGGDEAEARLETLVRDPYPDVRYNAATGLARHGNAAGVDVLLEMLDANESAGIDGEKQEAARDFKRAMIRLNALRATGQFVTANPTAELGRLREAVARLTRPDVDAPIRVKAVEVLDQLDGGSRGANASTPSAMR
jgi:HEAT repeat protein